RKSPLNNPIRSAWNESRKLRSVIIMPLLFKKIVLTILVVLLGVNPVLGVGQGQTSCTAAACCCDIEAMQQGDSVADSFVGNHAKKCCPPGSVEPCRWRMGSTHGNTLFVGSSARADLKIDIGAGIASALSSQVENNLRMLKFSNPSAIRVSCIYLQTQKLIC
ncbi:hypothetical protein ACFL9U_16095, partial [Thermodesulfobacteriota bacterium]